MKLILSFLFMALSCFLNSLDLELINNKRNIRLTGDFEAERWEEIPFLNDNYVRINIPECHNTGKAGEAELPVFSRLITLPAAGNFKISNLKYDFEEINLSHQIAFVGLKDSEAKSATYYSRDQWLPEEIVSVGDPNIMRSHRFVQITLAAVQYNPARNRLRILRNIDFALELDETINKNPLGRFVPSLAFDKIAEKNIIGAEEFPQRSQSGQYLIICPDAVQSNLSYLAQAKQKLGYKTKIAPLSETGSTETAIKNYIQNAYDNWEYPPEYVILVGDVTGSLQVPAFYVQGYWTAWDVTDHTYTLLAGDDYFPDVLIGRISVQNTTELNTVINKIINYEMNPYLTTSWTTKGLMVTYVQDLYWQFFSPRETVLAVREKLLNYEFTAVDTFIDPWQSGSANLRNMINTGYTFANYRGAGAPDYWAGNYGSMFGISDIQQLSNGYMLPLVTSITCGGGDFAYSGIPSVFGEIWLNAGTPTLPKGAIGFIGPSEHDTKTWFNNAYDMGIYQGVTEEGLFRCGEMLLRGKMELYINYPFSHNWGNSLNSDQFYFYVYNLLGDPGLQVWTTTPRTVSFDFEAEINSAANFLSIDIYDPIFNAPDFTVAITNDDSLITSGFTNIDGVAEIPVSLPAGTYSITVSKYGYIPKTEIFQVIDQNIVALTGFTMDDPVSGYEVNLLLGIQNSGDEVASSVEIDLNTSDPDLLIISGSAAIAALQPGESADCLFSFQIAEHWQHTAQTAIYAEITSSLGAHTFLIPFSIISPEVCLAEFIVQNLTECLMQNQNNTVFIELLNCGGLATGNLNVQLIPRNDNISIPVNQATYASLPVDGTGQNETAFQVFCAPVMNGEPASFLLEISNDRELLQELIFSIPIGIIDQTSPTFCDCGYYAVESSDSGYLIPPVYDWIEISTFYGGSGTEINPSHATPDGAIAIVDLPFNFRYFGNVYNTVSICTNGYLCMGATELIFTRNRFIPSGSGPGAMIAPFWDNLTNGHVFYKYLPNEHCFVIEWSDMRNVFNYMYETFQVILYDPQFSSNPQDNGAIKFQYKIVNNVDQNEHYATVGIENSAQTEGLLLSFANIYPPTMHPLANEKAILITSSSEPLVDAGGELISAAPRLYQNYPNPFHLSAAGRSSGTTISFETTNIHASARLEIYNIKGQKVKALECGNHHPASGSNRINSIVWDGTDQTGQPVAAGIYFYRLTSDNWQSEMRKCLLLK